MGPVSTLITSPTSTSSDVRKSSGQSGSSVAYSISIFVTYALHSTSNPYLDSFHVHSITMNIDIYVQEVYIIHYYRLINLISLPQHCQFLSHKVNCFFGLSIFHCVQTRTIPQWVAGQGPWNDTLLLYNINDAVVTVIYTRFVFMLCELQSRFFTVTLHM